MPIRSQGVSPFLLNASIAFRNAMYVAARVFPILDMPTPQAKLLKFRPGDYFRDEAAVRAPGTVARRSLFKTTSVALDTKQYAFGSPVTMEDMRDAGLGVQTGWMPPIDMEAEAVEFATDKVLLKKEIATAEAILNGTWVDGNTGGDDAAGGWLASSSNTFFGDIKAGVAKIQKNTGFTPNRLLIDFATFLGLQDVSDVRDRIKYTSGDSITPQMLAAMLDLEEVVVGKTIKNTAKEKKSGANTPAYIWEKNAGKGMGFLFYAPETPRKKTPSAGYQARSPISMEGGTRQYRQVDAYYEKAEKQWVYDVMEEVDITQICAECGYLWKDTAAS